jgi:hypothetical protein
MKTVLGFTQGGIVSNTLPIQSQTKAILNSLSNYVITCDFINGGFATTSSGLSQSNIIYSCTPDVSPYSQIIRNVENVLFVKVNKNRLENIQISILDQNLNPTDFTNGTGLNPEPFSVLLYIAPKSYLFKG